MPTKTARFDHSNCKHARTGAEGKKARAACRKAHEAQAKKAAAPKPATPRKRGKVVDREFEQATSAAAVKPQVLDMSNV